MNNDGIVMEYRIKLYRNGRKCFGPGMAEMLRSVRELGSLNAAAKSMDMAYSKACRMVRTAEKALDAKLLETRAGGANGGGAALTARGAELLAAYEGFMLSADGALNRLFLESFGK